MSVIYATPEQYRQVCADLADLWADGAIPAPADMAKDLQGLTYADFFYRREVFYDVLTENLIPHYLANVQTYAGRYNEEPIYLPYTKDYESAPSAIKNPVQTYKSIQFLLYQPEPEYVTDTDGLKVAEDILRGILADLGQTIISRLPEYSKSKWA